MGRRLVLTTPSLSVEEEGTINALETAEDQRVHTGATKSCTAIPFMRGTGALVIVRLRRAPLPQWERAGVRGENISAAPPDQAWESTGKHRCAKIRAPSPRMIRRSFDKAFLAEASHENTHLRRRAASRLASTHSDRTPKRSSPNRRCRSADQKLENPHRAASEAVALPDERKIEVKGFVPEVVATRKPLRAINLSTRRILPDGRNVSRSMTGKAQGFKLISLEF